MYGMIHRAVRQMVLEGVGKETWADIEAAARIGQSELISAEVYDDSVTLNLIECAARCVGVEVDQFMIEFGQYWIAYAELGSFGPILHFTGEDIATFLRNLDRLHESVQSVMPDARMPSFKVLSEEPGALVVAYHSHRSGLEPFVEGLLMGLLIRFNLVGTVSPMTSEGARATFRLVFEPRSHP